MKTTWIKGATLMLLAALFIALYACAENKSIARVHPVEVESMPICTKCHTDEYAAYSHTPDWISRHKFYGAQHKQACDACHKESFCSDCHANKEELKPSDKFKDEPYRSLPHRGDYLTQHMIDGKINPALCFKCHGRKNN